MAQEQARLTVETVESLQGMVVRRIFRNHENGYSVLAVDTDGQIVKASGYLPSVREGDLYRFTGYWTTHSRYGDQFNFTNAELVLPTDAAGLARYLSNITYGVGIAKARKIIEALGENALEKLKSNPEIIDTLDFLDDKQKSDIKQDLVENTVQAELAAMICREGIGPGIVNKIYQKYGEKSVKVVKENPYILCREVWGIGFHKADMIAQTVGIAPNSPYRVEAALIHTLSEAVNEGHTFLQPNDIVMRLIGERGLIEASGVGVSDIATACKRLIDEGLCYRDGDAIYLYPLYIAECATAEAINRLLEENAENYPEETLDILIQQAEISFNVEYEANQRAAIKTALSSGISVITGGPGTGKTTVVNAICQIYEQLHPDRELLLCAPTGRAAKRMAEVTNREAQTIHRLLRYKPNYDEFNYGYENSLPGPGLLIVDESSMVDIELMARLLSAATEHQVILVGDIDQLPSVGPGNVLRDCILSGRVPIARLTFNYRQAAGSAIAEYADFVRQGIVPPLESAGDFEYVEVEDADQAVEVIKKLVLAIKSEGLSLLDFQVLAPMHRGSAGVTNLNNIIRELMNPKKDGMPELSKYRIGDKVMVIQNNYDLEVFNGDLGVVVDIRDNKLVVDFGSFTQSFATEFLDLLTKAYASTIHKSQGSEFPLVIMPIVSQHYIMLARNLLYTGMTRAKKKLILIGDDRAIRRAVNNNKIEQRWSLLAERIRKLKKEVLQ